MKRPEDLSNHRGPQTLGILPSVARGLNGGGILERRTPLVLALHASSSPEVLVNEGNTLYATVFWGLDVNPIVGYIHHKGRFACMVKRAFMIVRRVVRTLGT